MGQALLPSDPSWRRSPVNASLFPATLGGNVPMYLAKSPWYSEMRQRCLASALI
ncbi:hypothetical protein IQE94_07945 [Synechocystis sp. PCC 7339]|uniref:hypothetical protein n=1 Tax=unclassified Synechocystis TaxID=2640012 RepID=UPI001BAEC5B0|nr:MULTISPECIES: hypothetical protein [unclassified Synechocystis]QUS61970.1 hypothetical protein HTZ78_15735 [Synechocystis sp. PCC 7338]UAJ74165.1 hypothetical protein IQE94_07945 [Synechocystis sp. PCC 7339]